MLTQEVIGDHLDLDQSSVSRLMSQLDIDWRISSLDLIRVAYIRHLREQAAGRATDGTIDLATERALLARAQREGQELKNEVLRGTYAPIELLADVLASASQAVVDRLEQIPADLRRVCPDLPQAARDVVMAEIASARNEMVRKAANLVADQLDAGDLQEDDDSAYACSPKDAE